MWRKRSCMEIDPEIMLDVFGDALCCLCGKNIHWFTVKEIIDRRYCCEDCVDKFIRRDYELQKSIV